MRDEADDLRAILDDVLGGGGPAAPPAPPPAPTDQTALRELIEWVHEEVFGPAA